MDSSFRDTHLGFMMDTRQTIHITDEELDTFLRLIQTHVGNNYDIEMTDEIKNQIIDAVMSETPLDLVAKRIARAIINRNKMMQSLKQCNKPQDRVIIQTNTRTKHGLESLPLHNTHYDDYLKQRMRFRT
jgi:uncharacterized protein YpuA (DUF1002 family)